MPATVTNPPGFRGHPDHDRADPRYDLTRYQGLDADAHFVHFDGPAPLVVRHEDGAPAYAIVGGELLPYEKWVGLGRPTA